MKTIKKAKSERTLLREILPAETFKALARVAAYDEKSMLESIKELIHECDVATTDALLDARARAEEPKPAPAPAPAPDYTPITIQADPAMVDALTHWHKWFPWQAGGVHVGWMAERLLALALAHPKELFGWYDGFCRYSKSEDVDQIKFQAGQIAARPEYKKAKCPA